MLSLSAYAKFAYFCRSVRYVAVERFAPNGFSLAFFRYFRLNFNISSLILFVLCFSAVVALETKLMRNTLRFLPAV